MKKLNIEIPKPKCTKCGIELNSVQNFDDINNSIHVCNPDDIVKHKADWDRFIKETQKKISDCLKTKEINEDQLKIRMGI